MSWNQLPPHQRAELTTRLTQKQLDALILWLAGCGYQTISTMTGLSVSTIRNRVKRARQIYDQVTKEEAA